MPRDKTAESPSRVAKKLETIERRLATKADDTFEEVLSGMSEAELKEYARSARERLLELKAFEETLYEETIRERTE